MNANHHRAPWYLLPLVLLTACEQATTAAPTPPAATAAPAKIINTTIEKPPKPTTNIVEPSAVPGEIEPIELEWDALIPTDWRPDKLMEEYDADNLSDDDPRSAELMEKLKTFWREAPVVHDFDGKTVKLPGFVVPVEMDANSIHTFLLVPYYGACIHTPPPPANQTVLVKTDAGQGFEGELFDTVWVTGTIRVEKVSNDLGDAGYQIEARLIEPYE